MGNRSQRPQNRPQIDPGASSGALGCFGGIREPSRDAPGRPRGPPGTPPELPRTLPGRSWDAPGSGRDHFLGSSGHNVLCETFPERFSTDFGLLRTSPDVDSAAHGQCFVRVERFWLERPDNAKIDHFDLPKGRLGRPGGRLGETLGTPWRTFVEFLPWQTFLEGRNLEIARGHVATHECS